MRLCWSRAQLTARPAGAPGGGGGPTVLQVPKVMTSRVQPAPHVSEAFPGHLFAQLLGGSAGQSGVAECEHLQPPTARCEPAAEAVQREGSDIGTPHTLQGVLMLLLQGRHQVSEPSPSAPATVKPAPWQSAAARPQLRL